MGGGPNNGWESICIYYRYHVPYDIDPKTGNPFGYKDFVIKHRYNQSEKVIILKQSLFVVGVVFEMLLRNHKSIYFLSVLHIFF